MSLVANSGLIRKAVFPAELLPMVSVLSNLVHFLFALPIVLAALVAGRLLGFRVGGVSALLLPAVILLHLPLVAGLALGVSALTVHFKDVRDLLANLLTLLFFLTPILFPLDSIRHLAPVWWAVRLNPFTPVHPGLPGGAVLRPDARALALGADGGREPGGLVVRGRALRAAAGDPGGGRMSEPDAPATAEADEPAILVEGVDQALPPDHARRPPAHAEERPGRAAA